MAVEDWSNTAASNTSLGSIAIGENAMSVNDINNAHREMMKQIADWRDGAIASLGSTDATQPLDATLTALAGLTVADQDLILATGADAFTTLATTAYGRTLLALADVAALKSTLGGITVLSSGITIALSGFVELDITGDGNRDVIFQWGSGTLKGNNSGSISYPRTHTNFAICVVSGGPSTVSREGDIHVTRTSGLTSQSILNSSAEDSFYAWFSVGK